MTQFDQRYQQVETQYNAEHITIVQPPFSLTEKQRKQNRTRMLDRLQAIWIEGVLEPSLQGAAQIDLELQNKPSAIVTPLWSVLREFDKTGRLSSAIVSIVQVYDQANGEVLILGEPGAGKTTLLLELTRALLHRARQDESHPLPVVFSLSSWATRRQPLTAWLASELHSRYQVPLPLAMSWIQTDQVLPLLDGLDEVAVPDRAACVEAINTYREEHGLLPTVVCSRQTDYFALSTRLLLRTAVVVQPLTAEQIESYLTSGGERLEALHQALHKDADLRALASTPLMLNVLAIAYQGTAPQALVATGSPGMKQEHVFAAYVQRMLTHRGSIARYTREQTIYWLSYLAKQMRLHSQTAFYIEQLQPDWLSGNQTLQVYDWLTIRLPAILIGVFLSLVIYHVFGVGDDGSAGFGTNLTVPGFIAYFIVNGELILIGGFLGGLFGSRSPPLPSRSREEKSRALWHRFLRLMGVTILIGLVDWVFWSYLGTPDSAIIPALSLGLCCFLLQVLLGKNHAIEPPSQVPSLAWWRKIWKYLNRRSAVRDGLLVGLVFTLIYNNLVLIAQWNIYSSGPLYFVLFNELRSPYGLLYGLVGGVLSGLLIGRDVSIQPTDRLAWSRRSLRKSLFSKQHVKTTLLIAVPIGALQAWTSAQNGELLQILGSGFGLSLMLTIGLSYWLLLGLFGGVSSETLEERYRTAPNQGIHRSAFNSLVLGFISAIIVFLIGVLYQTLSGVLGDIGNSLFYKSSFDLLSSVQMHFPSWDLWNLGDLLLNALYVGLIAGFINGGLACLRHYFLRFQLWRSGVIPWNYARFLDDAAAHILLRKVGGGYIFLHRLLLDYLADLEIKTGSEVSAESRQERLPSDTVSSVEPTGADERSDVPTVSLTPTPVLSEVPRLLPCGHERRPNARFCGVCGAPVPS